MQQKGISIESLKNRIEENGEKLSRTSISDIINGKGNPKLSTLISISKALNVDFSELFNNVKNNDKAIAITMLNGELKTFSSLIELKEYINSQ